VKRRRKQGHALRRRYGRSVANKRSRKRASLESALRKITPVNASDKDWTRHNYVLAFGAYGDTLLRVWGNSLDDALDEAVDWIADHAPGLLADDEVNDEYKRLVSEGMSEEEAQEEATVDTTTAGNAGNYLHSSEWTVVVEDPSRADIFEIQRRLR
jgi:hypothetical protein